MKNIIQIMRGRNIFKYILLPVAGMTIAYLAYTVSVKQYELNVMTESLSIRDRQEVIKDKLIKLSNEFYDTLKVIRMTQTLNNEYLDRFNGLWERLNHLENILAKLESREPRNFTIPRPIKDVVPPEVVSAEITSPQKVILGFNEAPPQNDNLFNNVIKLNLVIFVVLYILTILSSVFLTRFLMLKRQNKVIQKAINNITLD